MADQIVVLRDGHVEQVGSPIELYARPVNQFVAGFLGAPQMNFLDARVEAVTENGVRLSIDNGGAALDAAVRAAPGLVGASVKAGIRPEHLVLAKTGPLNVRLTGKELLGADTILFAGLQSGERIVASFRGIYDLAEGAAVAYAADAKYVHVFDADGAALPPLRPWREDYGAGAVERSVAASAA